MRNAVDRTIVPVKPRHGYIRMLRAASASSKEIRRKQCAVRWQITKLSIVSALASRSQVRQLDPARLPNVILFAARFWTSNPARYRDRTKLRKFPQTSNSPAEISLPIQL